MPEKKLLLEMSNISKSFPGVKALEDVSVRLEEGEVFAVVGENGAGKSTLIKILSGFYSTDSGEIKINGNRVRFKGPKDAIDIGINTIYQETSLIQDILMIGSGDSGLSAATKQWAAELKTPVHLQVFVTPTCPYCPQAVVLAHRLAMESDLIHADMVEASEFPELAEKYDVMGVPRTVINEGFYVEGAVPEGRLLAKLQEAVAAAPILS